MGKDQDTLEAMRHSLAHITATAVRHLWPKAKFGVGPVVENGFYYDIDLGDDKLSEEHLSKIEKEMRRVIQSNHAFERFELPIDEAIKWAKENHQPYKEELLHDLKRAGTTVAKDLDAAEMGTITEGEGQVENVSFYKNGDFTDLCRGPHVENTGKVGAFKLMRVSGAYWRGNEKNPQMQRVYGVAFETEDELKKHLEMLEEAKKRDHRKLGEDLKLFFISDNVGAGLPLLMPRGETIKNELMKYMRAKEEARGYQYVATPVLAQSKLYDRSGHASYYLENMYGTKPDEEGNVFYLKPMNCPHHHMIYEKLVESYRDLPLRLSEHAGLYRYELSGTLTGLIRMRGPITQNDSHIYVTPEQVEAEFTSVLELFEEVYLETGVKDYWFRLSLPDFFKEKYAGNKATWEQAAEIIRRCLKTTKAKYVEELDEAAFYGPKVDIQIRNVLGKEDSIATVQLDIVVPERMDITYIDEAGNKQYPLIIHKSIMGAFERFMAYLLEQTAGKLPVWLAPEQIRLITVNQEKETVEFAGKILEQAKDLGLRAQSDNSNESVGKKIRAAELMKIPYTIVLGEKEITSGKLMPRIRTDMAVQAGDKPIGVEQFLKTVVNEVKSRTHKSSLYTHDGNGQSV
jgi:threonyl-tRNA synthetase